MLDCAGITPLALSSEDAHAAWEKPSITRTLSKESLETDAITLALIGHVGHLPSSV